jgi:DNA invertase Pin-like site-specific DNA recombinase
MLVGYVLITINPEMLSLQQDALKQAGCERVIIDEVEGTSFAQPGLEKAFVLMRPGDTLVVWRLDRLGRSLQDVVHKMEELNRRRIGLRSLHEDIDTTGPYGQHQLRVLSALAAFERDLIRERTLAGLRIARAQGRLGGRRREVSPEAVQMAARLMKDPSISVREICEILGVSRTTLYHYVGPEGEIRKQ